MDKKERNRVFNEGIEESVKSLEIYRYKPAEGQQLSDTSATFNRLLDEFQRRIREQSK
jgi:hypothetical protein